MKVLRIEDCFKYVDVCISSTENELTVRKHMHGIQCKVFTKYGIQMHISHSREDPLS